MPPTLEYGMTLLLGHEKKDILVDTLSFFKKEREGHMGKWGYSSPLWATDKVRGGELWNLFTVLHDGYYIKKNQKKLILDNIKRLKELTNSVEQVVDFGCGGNDAIITQAIPILKTYKEATVYTPIDVNKDYVTQAEKIVTDYLGRSIVISPIHADFSNVPAIQTDSRKHGWLLGASTNFSYFPKDLSDLISNVLYIMGKNSYLTVCIDTNLDSKSIIESYDHSIHHLQEINLMHRLARDIEIKGDFNPDAWKYTTKTKMIRYAGENILLAQHVLVSTQHQSFSIEGQHFNVLLGEELIVDQSYKFSADMMNKIAWRHGLKMIDQVHDDQGRMALTTYNHIDG